MAVSCTCEAREESQRGKWGAINIFYFYLYIFFEGLYFQENFIKKTSKLKTRTIKSLKEDEIKSYRVSAGYDVARILSVKMLKKVYTGLAYIIALVNKK